MVRARVRVTVTVRVTVAVRFTVRFRVTVGLERAARRGPHRSRPSQSRNAGHGAHGARTHRSAPPLDCRWAVLHSVARHHHRLTRRLRRGPAEADLAEAAEAEAAPWQSLRVELLMRVGEMRASCHRLHRLRMQWDRRRGTPLARPAGPAARDAPTLRLRLGLGLRIRVRAVACVGLGVSVRVRVRVRVRVGACVGLGVSVQAPAAGPAARDVPQSAPACNHPPGQMDTR